MWKATLGRWCESDLRSLSLSVIFFLPSTMEQQQVIAIALIAIIVIWWCNQHRSRRVGQDIVLRTRTTRYRRRRRAVMDAHDTFSVYLLHRRRVRYVFNVRLQPMMHYVLVCFLYLVLLKVRLRSHLKRTGPWFTSNRTESRLFWGTMVRLFGPTKVRTVVRGSVHTWNFGSDQTEKSESPD